MPNSKFKLRALINRWEQQGRNHHDKFDYRGTLDEVSFHADLRYHEYAQFSAEGDFHARLWQWIGNLADEAQQRLLFQLLSKLLFIDRAQLRSLYKDAYRRIVTPWLCDDLFGPSAQLAADYASRVRDQLRRFALRSITPSFDFNEFLHVNDLIGLPKPIALGEDPIRARAQIPQVNSRTSGIVVLEDFVGTGHQAATVLKEVIAAAKQNCRMLFVPLVVLEDGADLIAREIAPVVFRPALVIPRSVGIPSSPEDGEPADVKAMRSLINVTGARVLERLSDEDDPPTNPFGYGGQGAMVVTSHNTPNNTLPLVHHRAPGWTPLFRRLHHSKDGL
jgi:hypothetical protein